MPIIIAAAVMTSAILIGFFFPSLLREHAAPRDWIAPLKPEITNNLVFQFVTVTNTNETLRLQEQVQSVANRARHHFNVMNFYLTTHYTYLAFGCIFGGLSAMALALITRRGWDNSGGCLISLFLSSTVCATFLLSFPNVWQMEYTAKANKLLYLRYTSLLNDARTFAASGDYARDNRTNITTAREFMFRLDDEIRKAGDIAIRFDPGKIPVYDLSTDKK